MAHPKIQIETHCCIEKGHGCIKNVADGFLVQVSGDKPRYRVHHDTAESDQLKRLRQKNERLATHSVKVNIA